MSHYFDEKQQDTKSNQKTITYTYDDHHFTFISDHGVFSKDHVDQASDLLLRTVRIKPKIDRVLDLGCGYGALGIVLGKVYALDVTLSDVNERALWLARKNCAINHLEAQVVKSRAFESIDNDFDLIVTNPPIRIGKQALYDIFKQIKDHLTSQGECWMVMHKKHGALSALKFLNQIGHAEVFDRRKGFHIILFKKSLTP